VDISGFGSALMVGLAWRSLASVDLSVLWGESSGLSSWS
jgi:hypothetical protein